jgi:hypothetical protein
MAIAIQNLDYWNIGLVQFWMFTVAARLSVMINFLSLHVDPEHVCRVLAQDWFSIFTN